MSVSSIEWTDATWNPVRGCTRVSEGCRNCYAERFAARGLPAHLSPTTGKPFAAMREGGPRWTGAVELIPSKLGEPLRWRKPQRVFVNSMSDLFHEALPDEAIDQVFAVMALAPTHTFQILTKRPARAKRWFASGTLIDRLDEARAGIQDQFYPHAGDGFFCFRQDHDVEGWPLPNVWLGVSVEDQATADARIPLLLQTPAAKRFVSYEPALGPVDFARYYFTTLPGRERSDYPFPMLGREHRTTWLDMLDQVIVGGESGPGAREFYVDWARSVRHDCAAAGCAFFMKQMGANVWDQHATCADTHPPAECWPKGTRTEGQRIRLQSAKGGDPAEWPADLRVREFPSVGGEGRA